MIIVSLLYFLLVCYLVFYVPGRFLLGTSGSFLGIGVVALRLGVGVTAFLGITYLLRFVQLDYLYVISSVLITFKQRRELFAEVRQCMHKDLFASPVLWLIATGSLAVSYITWNSGKLVNGDLVFYGQNAADGLYHVSLIKNLLVNYPMHHPGLADVPLRGYHFFYDLLLAHVIRYFHFDIYDSVFRLFPLFIAVFYGLSGYAMAVFFKAQKLVITFFIFLLYFSQGLQFFYFSYFANTFQTYNSGIVQGFLGIINPSVFISVALFFCAFVLLFMNGNWRHIVLGAIVLGMISQIKIHTFFLASIALGILSIFIFIKQRKYRLFIAFVISGLVACMVYLPTNLGAGGLLFAPLLLYTHFVEGPSFAVFPTYQWALKLQTYQAANNYLRIVHLYVIALTAFFIPTLGVRLVMLLQIKNIFSRAFYSHQNIFLLLFIGCSMLLASFFIQSVGVFNIIQFLWISYTILLLPTAFTLGSIAGRSVWRIVTIWVVLVVLLLPESVHAFRGYSQSPYRISQDFIKMSSQITNDLSEKESLLVLYRSEEYFPDGTPVISALTGRSVFYEPELTAFTNVHAIEARRIKIVNDVEKLIAKCEGNVTQRHTLQSILKDNQIAGLLTLRKPLCDSLFTNFTSINRGKYYYFKPN